MKTRFTLLLLILASFSAFAQVKISPHLSFREGIPNTITFNFYDSVALESQNQGKDAYEFRITDSVSVMIRAPKVTETISNIPMTNLAQTFTDFMGADNLLITIKVKGYEDLVQMCPLPKPIIAYDVYLRKKE